MKSLQIKSKNWIFFVFAGQAEYSAYNIFLNPFSEARLMSVFIWMIKNRMYKLFVGYSVFNSVIALVVTSFLICVETTTTSTTSSITMAIIIPEKSIGIG